MRLHLALPSLLMIVACGGGNKPAPKIAEVKPDPIPHTAGPECKVVADHMVTVVSADTPDLHAKLGAALQTRCTTDKWSDEARSCLATMENEAETEGCVKLLSDAQRKALSDEGAKLGMADDEGPKTLTEGAAPPPDKSPKPRATRGATKKQPKGGASDPCQGGE